MDSAATTTACALEITKNGQCFTACFLSAQDNVSKTTEAISTWMQEGAIDPECISEAALALSEALNNVVEHAYNWAEDGRIELRLNLHDDNLRANITDQGAAFDGPPEKKEMGNHEELGLMDLPEGGFGWFMIHSFCKEISFVRENNRNNLTLTLAASPSTGA